MVDGVSPEVGALAIMQPYLFPYIGYFHLMHAAERFVVFDDAAYIRRGWINRNRILLNGAAHRFTVPVRGASRNSRINELERGDDDRWRSRFLETLEHAYHRAPHFEATRALVKSIFDEPELNLAKWITLSLRRLAERLGIRTTILVNSTATPGLRLAGEARIIEICRRHGATRYVNAIGGQLLYSRDAFAESHVRLEFVRSEIMPYRQFGAAFVPGLSIIDVLMFNDPERTGRDLFTYDLIVGDGVTAATSGTHDGAQ